MNLDTPKLDLKGYGLVQAEILWVEGNLYKIKYIIREMANFTQWEVGIFHNNEILNLGDIFIDDELRISNYGDGEYQHNKK